jgi:hypothetical protein
VCGGGIPYGEVTLPASSQTRHVEVECLALVLMSCSFFGRCVISLTTIPDFVMQNRNSRGIACKTQGEMEVPAAKFEPRARLVYVDSCPPTWHTRRSWYCAWWTGWVRVERLLLISRWPRLVATPVLYVGIGEFRFFSPILTHTADHWLTSSKTTGAPPSSDPSLQGRRCFRAS